MIKNNSAVLRILEERLGKPQKDDKDASGNWTPQAISRYRNRYSDGTLMKEDEDPIGDEE